MRSTSGIGTMECCSAGVLEHWIAGRSRVRKMKPSTIRPLCLVPFAALSVLFVVLIFAPCSAVASEAGEPEFLGRVVNGDFSVGSSPMTLAQAQGDEDEEEEELEDWEREDLEEEEVLISDPLEPINRAFFHFNDKLYFWVLKPVARGYRWMLPEGFRVAVKNFFHNIETPIRAGNCLLQGKFSGFGNELLRFFVNSTVGCLGFQDPAKTAMGIPIQDEDFDQTLGAWGVGQGIYIHWPIFGPSSVRGTLGLGGDFVLDPLSWPVTVVKSAPARWGIKGYSKVNSVSLIIGDYEALKEAAIDPYISIRNAYVQNRKKRVSEEE